LISKNNKQIVVHEDKCTGCIICQLICSFINKKQFNPSLANLKIKNQYGLKPEITFLDDCIKCFQCAKHCLYGALEIKEVDGS
jgi:NAD-dependent dihydropyrimidine dehydrogenase PreA subunit